MKLRTKTLLLTMTALFAVGAALATVSTHILARGFAAVEEQDALQNLSRARAALAGEADALATEARDYAAWDDTYAYLEDHNPRYVDTNYNDPTFVNLRLNLVALADEAGALVWSRAFDLKAQRAVPLTPAARSALLAYPSLLRPGLPDSSVAGIVLLPSGPMLVATRPVLMSDFKGPPRGALLMGRYLDAPELKRLAGRTQLDLTLGRLDDPLLAPTFRAAAEALTGDQATRLVRESDATLLGFLRLHDVEGRPAALLRVALPRRVHAQGRATAVHLAGALLALGAACAVVVAALLDRLVLRRIAALSEGVMRVGGQGDADARLSVDGSDELAALGGAINQALDRLSLARRDLQGSEARYRSVVTQLAEGIALASAGTQRLVEGNEAFAQLTGYAPEELGDLSLRDVLELPQRDLERGLLEAQHGVWRFGELRCRRRDGSTVEVEASARVVGDGRGLLCFVVLDLTDRKLAEEEVRRANEGLERRVEERTEELSLAYSALQTEVAERVRAQEELASRDEQLRQAQKLEALGRLAGGVAHDFNNLLTAINSYAELLSRHLAGQDRLLRYAQGIEKTAERAAGLTRQLLAFSRRQILQPSHLQLNRVVEGIEPLLRRLIGEDIELTVALGADPWTVCADEGQVEQVLLNLIVNARDAMPGGGKVTVTTENASLDAAGASRLGAAAPGDFVRLSVTDTGVGMDADTLQRAFDPFFTTKPAGEGTGLGLATVYGIAAQSGGCVWATSEPGRGSTFEVYLPRDAHGVPRSAAVSRGELARGASPAGETVLLAEDDNTVRIPVSEGLRAMGYVVVEAGDGEQALEAARGHEGRIDLLLTDVVMPRLNGRELADRLRAERPGVKVLYMSGYPDDAVVRSGVVAATAAYLQKPFSLEALARRVRELLDDPP